METTSPRHSLPPFASHASWVHLAAIITAILAVIGSLSGGEGSVFGTIVATILNPIAWLAIWFWVKSKRFTCPHCGVGIAITSELTMQEVGSILRCPQCRNESRKPDMGGHGGTGNEFTEPQFQSVDWYREQWKKYTDVNYWSALLRAAVNSYLEVLEKCAVFILSPLFILSPITFNTVLNCYLAVLNKSGQFGGRARRKEFWMFVLVHNIVHMIFLTVFIVLLVVLAFIEKLLGITSPIMWSLLAAVFSVFWILSATISSIAVGIRRLHDTDHRGWWGLCPIAPWIFAIQDGQRGNNRFGPDPKTAKPTESVEIPPTSGVSVAMNLTPKESPESHTIQSILKDRQSSSTPQTPPTALIDPSDVEMRGKSNQIQQAFETMSDPDKRARYDAEREADVGESPPKKSSRGRNLIAVAFILLVILATAIHLGKSYQDKLTRYRDVNGDSGISAYRYAHDWIQVQFTDGGLYEYRASKIGQTHIDEMKRLADSGDGLNTYINTNPNVKHGWSSQYGETEKGPKRANAVVSTSTRSSASRTDFRNDETEQSSSTKSYISLTGRWKTSNGEILDLTESGDQVHVTLVESSAWFSGSGTLTRKEYVLTGELSGMSKRSGLRYMRWQFKGTMTAKNRIDYSVDFFASGRAQSPENRPAYGYMSR